nr:MAG TPA_asm: hypothetical protein [Caudoviricetes sp.]
MIIIFLAHALETYWAIWHSLLLLISFLLSSCFI